VQYREPATPTTSRGGFREVEVIDDDLGRSASGMVARPGFERLVGMRAAFDEILANGLKRQHSIPQIIGDLLQAEIAEKQARSIKYQVAIARLPLAKELCDFDFSDTPINDGLVRDLATGSFHQNERNAVLVGGTGTGKRHFAVAIACAGIRDGARGRFHTAGRLEAEARAGRQSGIADRLTRLGFLILDELGYLPFAQSGGQLLLHLVSPLYEQTPIIVTTSLTFEWGVPSNGYPYRDQS
jgi:DNA replication protein DnaC